MKKSEEKILIFDSGTIINLAMNGLLDIIEKLKEKTKVRFCVTKYVKYETLDRPINVPRFELEALRVKKLLDDQILETPDKFNISDNELEQKTREYKETANQSVFARGKWIEIVSDAEMSCLALSSILTKRGVKNIIAIDERTTRLLAEKPENLRDLMSKKLHFYVKVDFSKFGMFKEFVFIRSTELVFVAFKMGLIQLNSPKLLEAVLFATKYKGSSVSFEEIETLKKL